MDSTLWHTGMINECHEFEGDTSLYGTDFNKPIANIQTDNDVIVVILKVLLF